MEVVAYDPYVATDDPAWQGAQQLDLNAVLSTSDVISIHLPLTQETRGLIGKEAFARMKPDAILVNAARGGVMDEAALVAALKAGKLGGAALDVFEQEPLRDGAKLFAGTPNLILTPHIAGNTVESNGRVSGLVAERVIAALEGRL
jgi:(S)-sulfolactate dehydrogenase